MRHPKSALGSFHSAPSLDQSPLHTPMRHALPLPSTPHAALPVRRSDRACAQASVGGAEALVQYSAPLPSSPPPSSPPPSPPPSPPEGVPSTRFATGSAIPPVAPPACMMPIAQPDDTQPAAAEPAIDDTAESAISRHRASRPLQQKTTTGATSPAPIALFAAPSDATNGAAFPSPLALSAPSDAVTQPASRRASKPLQHRTMPRAPQHPEQADHPFPLVVSPSRLKSTASTALPTTALSDERESNAVSEEASMEIDLAAIPARPIVVMDMRKWGELLPKALHDSFDPVVKLCELTPDASKPSDNTLKHAMDARDNRTSKIGRGGAEISMPPENLLLATLPDGHGGVGAAMWAIVESVERDRRRGPYAKVSVVRVVIKPEFRRGPKELQRRNVKLDLFLALVDAFVGEAGCHAFTIADVECISTKRGAMWTRIFQAARVARPRVAFEAEGLDAEPRCRHDRVTVLPCLWTDSSSAPPAGSVDSASASQTVVARHPADVFVAKMQEENGWTAEADMPDARLGPGRNLLIHPYSAEEKAARAVAAVADAVSSKLESVFELACHAVRERGLDAHDAFLFVARRMKKAARREEAAAAELAADDAAAEEAAAEEAAAEEAAGEEAAGEEAAEEEAAGEEAALEEAATEDEAGANDDAAMEADDENERECVEGAIQAEQTEAEALIEAAPLPSTLADLIPAVAGSDAVFGLIEQPERALITPAMKAFKKAGGTDRRLSKKKPLPEGYYLLQARRRLSPQLSSVPQYAPS